MSVTSVIYIDLAYLGIERTYYECVIDDAEVVVEIDDNDQTYQQVKSAIDSGNVTVNYQYRLGLS